MRPVETEAIIAGKRYSTKTATLLASDAWWDGRAFERNGRNTFLYRTPRGAYFALHRTQWQGECDSIEPLSEDKAVVMYERMAAHGTAERSFAEAFPARELEDA